MANKPKAEKAKAESKQLDRVALNDKARYDYGILNAADMSDEQLLAEIAAIDKTAKDAK